MTKEKIPDFRFSGYTDAWEERKLGEVAEFYKGKGYSKGDLIEEGSPIILYGRLYTNYELVIHEVDTFVSENSDAIISHGGEVVVPSSGESPEDIAIAAVVEQSGIILGGDLNVIDSHETLSPVFLALLISNGSQKKELSKRAQGKSIVHLHNSDLKNIALLLPSLPEQESIGNFFRQLDDLLTLHQRQLDLLKERKKTYLKLLFPAKGQKVPALRFDSFEGDWEEKKLGKVAEMYQPITISSSQLQVNGFPVFGANGYIGYYEEFNHNTDQVTISARGEGAGTPNYVKGPVWITGNSMVINIDENKLLNKHYLYNLLKSMNLKKYVTGGAQPQLTRDVLDLVKIQIPSLPEQEAIGNFFSTLDEEITQVEKKLASLKTMKATLLRKLFV